VKKILGKSGVIRLALLLGGLLTAASVACGGTTVETVVQTVVVERQVAGDTVVQTVIVTEQEIVEKEVAVAVQVVVTATVGPAGASPPPAPAALTGKLTIAVGDVGTPLFVNANGVFPTQGLHRSFGILEAPIYARQGKEYVGALVEDWVMAPDQSKVTFYVRQGVTFRGKDRDWGAMTAEDMVWSINDAGAGNPASHHDNADILSTTWDPWEVVSDYVIDAPFKQFRGDWLQTLRPNSVVSKTVFDEVGATEALETMVGTGPFVAQKWLPDERLEATARPDYWNISPNFKELVVIEAPEALTRVAMLKTGEADISDVPLREVPALQEQGYIPHDGLQLSAGQAIQFAGNYWLDHNAETLEPHPIPGWKPDADHPWIGDPNDPVRHESARKVRLAMSIAIDRALINETILDGLGDVCHIVSALNGHPEYKPKWTYNYDPDLAKQLLVEAGYPDGFTFELFLPSDVAAFNPEIGEAVTTFWEAIGLNPKMSLGSYTARRPQQVNREMNVPWMKDNGNRAATPGGTTPSRWPHAGWSPGFGSQQHRDFWVETKDQVAGSVENLASRERYNDFMFEAVLRPCVVQIPKLWVYDGNTVFAWDLQKDGGSNPNNLESVILRQK
jgi:ABC-type transport system substrate-binding protein